MILALLNQKGGVGKTTLATHIAGELALRGQHVVLLDADPQGSSLDWTQRRSQQGLPRLFSAVGLARETLHQEAPELARRADHVVIDGPPRIAALARSALLAAERDPFQPVEDPCRTAQLSQWRYGGAAGDGAGWTGFLQDGSGKWRRVRMDDQLPTGWRVSRLTAGELEIVTPSGCEPPAWRWQREGKQYDAMDKPSATAAAAGGGRRPK